MTIKNEISRVGQKVVSCKKKCDGIVNDPKNNIYPRCFVYELKNSNPKSGFIFVGMNPGHSKKNEIEKYNNYSGKSDADLLAFQHEIFFKQTRNEDYYKEIDEFINNLNSLGILNEAIIWTESFHCQKAHDAEKLSNNLISFRDNIMKVGFNLIDSGTGIDSIGDSIKNWETVNKLYGKFKFNSKPWRVNFNKENNFQKEIILNKIKSEIKERINQIDKFICDLNKKNISINSINYKLKLNLKHKDFKEYKIPISTYSACVNNHLNSLLQIKELEKWPIFVFDNIAFDYICLAFPERKVVRLVHPSRGNLKKINNDPKRLNEIADFIKNKVRFQFD